jgi:hypothetical protein
MTGLEVNQPACSSMPSEPDSILLPSLSYFTEKLKHSSPIQVVLQQPRELEKNQIPI